jgi:threonine efflux protein
MILIRSPQTIRRDRTEPIEAPMQSLASLLAVASIWSVATVSPGPNFLLSARISAAQSRAHGLAVVSGIGVATAIWGWAGLLGIQALFVAAPWFYAFLKLAGAAYLVVTGARMILGSRKRDGTRTDLVPPGQALSLRTTFRIGLVTSLANPRSALSVPSIFAAALPAHPATTLGTLAIALMVAISVAWYVSVVYLFTTGFMASTYDRLRHWIDRTAGVLLVWFGTRLALDRA